MFDRKAFMEYVGEKSGTSYASGLKRIETDYGVDLESEYEKDGCAEVFKRLSVDKRNKELPPRIIKRRSDQSSHLKRYILFKGGSVAPEQEDDAAEVSEINPEGEPNTPTDVKLNTILYGPPGTGKTYNTVIYSVAVVENCTLASVEAEEYAEVLRRYNIYRAQGRIEFITFHQSYGYEEFIEGIKPVLGEEGNAVELGYMREDGVFKQFCAKAKADRLDKEGKVNNRVFIIDEINRGNISKIFGELITLIEPSKRIGKPEGMEVMLPYSKKPFGVPDNVYIIGTMNTADRSIATIDTALRRRFFFREMQPDPAVLEGIAVEGMDIKGMLERMNQRISVLYDREHTIGHAYFLPLRDKADMETLGEIFSNNILPLLQEYFYENYEKIRLVLGDNRKKDKAKQFVVARKNDYAKLFGDEELGLDEASSYEINFAAFYDKEAYSSI